MPIAVRCRVKTKAKPHRFGTVIEAVENQTWRVELDRDEYADEPLIARLTSRQLIVLNNNNSPVNPNIVRRTAAAARNAATKIATPAKSTAKKLTSRMRRRGRTTTTYAEESSSTGDDRDDVSIAPSELEIGTPRSLFDGDLSGDDTSSELLQAVQEVLFPNNNENENENNHADIDHPDEDSVEDVNLRGVEDEDDGCVADVAQEHVDEDERRRAGRKAKFDEKKNNLLGTTITKTITNSSSIDVGSRVATRKKFGAAKRPKVGTVLRKIIPDPEAPKKFQWEVKIDNPDGDGSNEVDRFGFGPTQLVRHNANTAAQSFVWTYVKEHTPDNPKTEYEQIGVLTRGRFKMSDFNEDADPASPTYNHPFAELFKTLWPGDPEKQRAQMNRAVAQDNRKRAEARSLKKIKEFTRKEWWSALAVILYGGVEGGAVNKLYPRSRKVKLPYVRQRDSIEQLSGMKRNRFEQFKQFFPEAFEGNDPDDPWNKIGDLLKGFNENRLRTVAASIRKVLDEIMSHFQPRSTAKGGLPHLSFIKRKPRPWGIEYKALVCSVTCQWHGIDCCIFNFSYLLTHLYLIFGSVIMIHLELQRGKEEMNKDKYGMFQDLLGATASCVKRIMMKTAYCGIFSPERNNANHAKVGESYIGDAWFAGVRAAMAAQDMRHELFGPVKTVHSGFPRDEMKEALKDAPSGAHLVMECEASKLFAVGYRYSLRSDRK